MSAKTAKTRVQLTDADRKLICELAKSNRDQQLPGEQEVRSTAMQFNAMQCSWHLLNCLQCIDSMLMMQVENDLTDDELIALVSDPPEATESATDVDSCDEVEEIVTAPSLLDMRQQLKGFAAFMADNPQFTAEDENVLQRFTDKVAKMLVSRVNHRQQQSITSYFTAI